MKKKIRNIIAVVIALIICFTMCSCSPSTQSGTRIDPNGSIIAEEKINGDILTEDRSYQSVLSEVYLKEIVVVENKISEMLIQDDRIEEVLLCHTVYVPQDKLLEFSQNSGYASLFENVDFAPILTKVAIGTGVILTLTVLSVTGLEGPVGSVIASAAPAAFKASLIGAGVGSLLGGLIGSANVIDDTGRMSAIIGLASAVVGLVLTTVSVLTAIPSGGSSVTAASLGVKMVLAGVSLIGTAVAGYNAVKTFTTTDCKDIDWGHVNWNKVGESAAKQAINGVANGYMWGSIIGAVSGGAEGLDNYRKYNSPYSSYENRIKQTPANGVRGHWTGERGESIYRLDEPIKLPNGREIYEITYHNGIPDFSPYAEAQVDIVGMTNQRYGISSQNIIGNFDKADEQLASYWTKIKYNGKSWSVGEISTYRTQNQLTWHEMNNMKSMQLVPQAVNSTWGHLGGVGEYNALINLQGGTDFD